MAISFALMGMVVAAVAASALTVAVMAVWQRQRARRCRCVTGILDSSTDGVFAVDGNWHLIYMNDRARVLLNASASAAGRCLWDVVPGVVAGVFSRPCRQALEQQEAVELEVFYPPLEAWFALCAFPIPDGLAVTFRDVTAAKRQQDKRRVAPAADAEPVAQMEDFPLAGLMKLATAAHRPAVEGKGLCWDGTAGADGGVDAGVMVRSDRVLLLRMIGGLMDTALRHSAAGSIGLECRTSPRAVQIMVRSTGASAEAQGEAGLAAVRSLSRRLNHPVETHTAPSTGSEWIITVPRGRETIPASVPAPARDRVKPAAVTSPPVPAPAPVRAAASAFAGLEQGRPPAPSAGQTSRRCILLVDDDPIVLMGLEAVLSEWGYDIVTAASADQAMERLSTRGRQPDMVMADYQLRNNRVGTEVVSRVRERFGPVPGVILTGETGGSCHVEAEAMGLAVMVKPVTPQQLAAALGRTPPAL